MGAKLIKIFEVVTQKTGNNGRFLLAEKTGISRATAASMEDKPEIVKRAMEEASLIIGESIEKYL
jgi:hypothetical protein